MSTHQLDTDGATITFDVRGPLPTADGRPPLVMIGSPMDASGFGTLVSYFEDRTVVTYDPRGLGRSTRSDGSEEQRPEWSAADVHAVIGELGVGKVDLFGSSGGAINALALVAAYPDDVATLVAHEPPLIPVLPDAGRAIEAGERVEKVYMEKGWGHGMAAFIQLTSWQGEFDDAYFAQDLPDPAAYGMPTEDDGSRNDPLLSDSSDAVSGWTPDIDAVTAAPTRVVIAAGIESKDTMTWRTAACTADALGLQLAVFPSHHGGFMGGEFGYPGEPEAFAARLREVLG